LLRGGIFIYTTVIFVVHLGKDVSKGCFSRGSLAKCFNFFQFPEYTPNEIFYLDLYK
jgi:hypothetical protein